MSEPVGMSRRKLFQLLGGGIVIFIGLGTLQAQDGGRLYPEDFNAYLVIGEGGRVTVFSGKIEMGQGALTSQAQMVAEELGVALDAIDMVLGDTDKCPWDMGTFGSLTTRMFGPALRAAAAQARLVLLNLGAKTLDVAPHKLTSKDGFVFVADAPHRKLSYGEISKGARIAQVVDKKAVLRKSAQFEVMGTSPKRLDGVAKVTGAAKYAADIRLPEMLYASLLRPPMHGATLLELDKSGAQNMPGVTLVHRADLVAALHTDPQVAALALARIQAQWRLPQASLDPESIFEHIERHSGEPQRLAMRGDVEQAKTRAAKVFETTYHKGYVAHAAIEPHAALAEVKQGKATVWASTQTPFPTRDRVAQALGMDPGQVRVITGRPVQVAWTRAEEFFNDSFDPAAVVKIVSGLDSDAGITLWDYTVFAAGDRGTGLFYDIPNTSLRSAGRAAYETAVAGKGVHPFSVGPWRAPGANMNVFAVESQIDIMACAARMDPVAFRLRHLSDTRMRRALQTAAQSFGWKTAAAPSGAGFGVACSADAGSYVATMAEVKVNVATGEVKVLRIVCAQDMGIVVNPEGAKMQMEGGIAMGLGYALSEELRFRGAQILDRNFDSYSIPRFSSVPSIQAVLIRNDELAPQGGGEPSITTTGAVIANAIFDATGARLTRLPMTPERVRQALASKNPGA